MVKNGIDRIKISVSDLEASKAFFRDVMEMSVVDECELDAASMQTLWDLPADTKTRAAYLKNDEQPTALELIQFDPNSGRTIRADAAVWDLGLFDVAFRAKGIDEIYTDLSQKGYAFLSEPVVYTADWARVTVKEVILIGPDQMPVALIERLSEPIPFIKNRFGTLVDAAQFVDDVAAVSRFYSDILGYTSVFDSDLPDGLIDPVLGLPAGTSSRMAFLLQPETNTPAVELIKTSAPGKSLADVIQPMNIGLFGLAFETADLDELKSRIENAGYALLSGPLETTLGMHGPARTMIIRGPNGALLEFFQK